MFATWMVMNRWSRFDNFTKLMLALAVSLLLISGVTPVFAQDQSQAPPQDNTQNSPQNNGRKIPRKLLRLHLRPLRPRKSRACPTIPSR